MLRGDEMTRLSISSDGKKLHFSKWNDDEIAKLRELYKASSKHRLLSLFPGRTWNAIRTKAERLGVLKFDGKAIYIHNNGYVLVRARNYPANWRGKWKDGRVYEHNLVWYLCNPNDPILKDESIHHINGDKQDNRIENLQKLKDDAHGFFTMKGEMPEDYEDEEEPVEFTIGTNEETWEIVNEIEREIAIESRR